MTTDRAVKDPFLFMRDGPDQGSYAAVAVPLRNEAARLPRLLAALAEQRGAPAFTLCLFLDNCDDGSADLIAAMRPVLPYAVRTDCCRVGREPNAGFARGRAMAMAMECAPDGILLTTDADSRPAADWVAANAAALDHADLVAGRILRALPRAPDMHDRLCAYYDQLHALRRALDPVPWDAERAHHWTSGASLAIRARHYHALGGFKPIASGEDALLADEASRAGLRLRRDGTVMVETSSRRDGRVQGGFSSALAAFDEAQAEPLVAHPEDEAWRYRLHAKARHAYDYRAMGVLAAELGLPPSEIQAAAAQSRNGEAFAARVVGKPPGGMRAISLSHAEASLIAQQPGDLAGAA